MESMAGIQYIPTLKFFDVLHDGTLVGTVHLVPGGWVFYGAGRTSTQRIPTAIGMSRDAAVINGMRQMRQAGGLQAGRDDPNLKTP